MRKFSVSLLFATILTMAAMILMAVEAGAASTQGIPPCCFS